MLDQSERYINPYTDFGFKKLFGTTMNKELLISFLNALLEGKEKPITDIHYLNTEHLGEYAGNRNSVFDVYCQTEDGSHFIVEMQKGQQHYFKDRTVYYAASVIREQTPKGVWDYRLQDVYTVSILNFTLPESKFPDNTNVANFAVEQAEKKGRAEGKIEGRTEEKLESARKMKAKGYPIDDIAEITGLTLDQIEKL